MPRTLDDLQGDRYQQIVAGSTPYAPGYPTQYPTPMMSGSQLMDSYRQQMFSSINIGAMQAQGLAQAQSMNISNPYQVPYGAAAGMAPSYMMTSANLSPFRPQPPPPPPALMATPGVTNQFTNPADLAVQYQMMRTGMFADPGSAAENYGRMRLHRFGQSASAAVGTAVGVGAQFIPGMQGLGGSILGSLGSMAMENLNEIPGIGSALRWGIGAMNQNVAEQLAWTGGAQHGTYGRVAMGRGEAGLGGRGMNMGASMNLGRQMRQMSLQTGTPDQAGSFNQVDMMNLLRTAGDTGFLESATNVDQISKTVGNLMKLVGSLAKITGDPDFRNNLRELGNMRLMGLSAPQGMQALESMNNWARMSGMTRSQLMETGALPGATRAAAAGLTPAVGMMAGAYGQGQARMMQGTFSETQKALFGDIGQVMSEGQIGFAAGVAPHLIPGLLTSQGGKVSLDQKKINKLLARGPLDMTQLAGEGAANLYDTAKKQADALGTSVPDAILGIQMQMRELQSELIQKIGPVKTEQLRYQLFQGQKDMVGGPNAAALWVTGNNEVEAQVLMKKWSDPRVRDRLSAFAQEEQGRLGATVVANARSRRDEMADLSDVANSSLRQAWRSAKQWWQEPMKMTASDLRKADDEIRRIQRDTNEAQGVNKIAMAGVMTFAGEDIMDPLRKAVKEGKWGGSKIDQLKNFREGDDQFLTEEEASLAMRWSGEGGQNWMPLAREGTVSGMEARGQKSLSWGTMGWIDTEGMRTRIKRARGYKAQVQETAKAVMDAAGMGSAEFAASNRSLLEALGNEKGMKPAAHVLNQISTKIISKAASKGKVGQPVSVEELRQEAIDALVEGGLDRKSAERTVNDQKGFFNKHIVKTISESLDPDAQRALQGAVGDEVLANVHNIGKGEDALKDAEQVAADQLGEAGILSPTGTIGGSSATGEAGGAGEDIATQNVYSFTEGARDAMQAFFKGGRDIGVKGLGEGGGSKGAMLSLLVAQQMSGTDEQKTKAGEILAGFSGDEKTANTIQKIRESLKGSSTEKRQTMARMGSKFISSDFKGSSEEALASMTTAESQTISSGKGAAAPIYDLLKNRAFLEETGLTDKAPGGKKADGTPAAGGKGGSTQEQLLQFMIDQDAKYSEYMAATFAGKIDELNKGLSGKLTSLEETIRHRHK
jgi:hypothetical protein